MKKKDKEFPRFPHDIEMQLLNTNLIDRMKCRKTDELKKKLYKYI